MLDSALIVALRSTPVGWCGDYIMGTIFGLGRETTCLQRRACLSIVAKSAGDNKNCAVALRRLPLCRCAGEYSGLLANDVTPGGDRVSHTDNKQQARKSLFRGRRGQGKARGREGCLKKRRHLTIPLAVEDVVRRRHKRASQTRDNLTEAHHGGQCPYATCSPGLLQSIQPQALSRPRLLFITYILVS